MCRQYLHGRGTRFYPPTGGASRAFGLPLAAKRFLRAGAHTHFCGPRAEGQREETGRCPAMDSLRPAGFCYAVDKEEATSPLSLIPRTILSLFAPVSRYVGRMGTGWHPYPCRPSLAAVGSLCGNAQIPLSPMPSGSYECSDNSSHNPWLSRKCSGMVCFPATPYQNFYAREDAETWKSEQETGSSPSG